MFGGVRAAAARRLHFGFSSPAEYRCVCSSSKFPRLHCQLSDAALRAELQRLVPTQPGALGHRGLADAAPRPGGGVLLFDEQAELPPHSDDLLHLLLCPPHALVDTLRRRRARWPDDYALAPASASELLAKVQLLARSGRGSLRACQVLKDFFHDPLARRAIWQGRLAQLTARESSLLAHLAARPGAAVERDTLIQGLSPWGQDLGSNAVDVHVHGLRGKLAPELIETVRGVGYRLTAQGLD